VSAFKKDKVNKKNAGVLGGLPPRRRGYAEDCLQAEVRGKAFPPPKKKLNENEKNTH